MDETLKLPATVTFLNADGLEASGDGDKIESFRIIANSGSRMSFWHGDVVIDMNGIRAKKSNIPILYGHNTWDIDAGIGHVTNFGVQNGQLILEGVVSRDTPCAKEFVASCKKGFPWEASVGGKIMKSIAVAEKKSHNVNGRTEEGPLTIATDFEVYETSVVLFGADSNTSALVNSSVETAPFLRNGEKMNEDSIKDEGKALEASLGDVKNEAQEPVVVQASVLTEDTIQAEREKLAAEARRVGEIRNQATSRDDLLVAEAIEKGWDLDTFKLHQELSHLREDRGKAPAIHAGKEDMSSDGKVLEAFAVRYSGLMDESKYEDRTLEAADKIGNIGFQEFCELACGRRLGRYQSDPTSWLQAAFTTQNLNYVLTRSFNAILLAAFTESDSEWRKVYNIGRVKDFKKYERYRINPVNFMLEPLTDGGKYKHGQISDSAYEAQIDTYGKMYAITRKDMVNDDMGVFTQIPRFIGYGASETLNRKCWSLFLNPAADPSDSKAFYHEDHNNLVYSSPLSLENISKVRAAFAKAKKTKGTAVVDGDTPLGIRPEILVCPIELEDTALGYVNATYFNNGSAGYSPADYNPHKGRWQVVSTPFLSESTFTGYSATTWYMMANPRRFAAFEINFLNGKDSPTILRADADFDTDGIQFKGYFDFGLSQQDYRAITKCIAAAKPST